MLGSDIQTRAILVQNKSYVLGQGGQKGKFSSLTPPPPSASRAVNSKLNQYYTCLRRKAYREIFTPTPSSPPLPPPRRERKLVKITVLSVQGGQIGKYSLLHHPHSHPASRAINNKAVSFDMHRSNSK